MNRCRFIFGPPIVPNGSLQNDLDAKYTRDQRFFLHEYLCIRIHVYVYNTRAIHAICIAPNSIQTHNFQRIFFLFTIFAN